MRFFIFFIFFTCVFSQKKCDKAIEKAIKLKQYFDQNEFNVNELKKNRKFM